MILNRPSNGGKGRSAPATSPDTADGKAQGGHNSQTASETVSVSSLPATQQHYYCGLPRAPVNKNALGSDPHQAGWLAGKWTSSTDDHERVDALRKLGILLTVRGGLARRASGREGRAVGDEDRACVQHVQRPRATAG
jgi:hypothetical protein